jgi:hypothetical protein
MMDADGIEFGRFGPDGGWVKFYTFDANDTGAAGLTVPTKSMKDGLNASKDKETHYDGSFMKPVATGNGRGAIVVVDRMTTDKGQFVPMTADDISGTLFHELFHAGRISRGEPNSHKDKRFQSVITLVDDAFKHCVP